MDALIFVFIGGVIYLGIAMRFAFKDRVSTEEWFKTLQVILVVGGFMLAGYWYFLERKSRPHANITQTTHAYLVSPGLVAVEAHTNIENLGTQVLRLQHARVALQLVSPGRYDYQALWALRGDDYWNAPKPGATLADGGPNPFFHRGELRWFPIRDYDRAINHEIEPGETDLLVTTFLVRCNANVVRVAADITKGLTWFDHMRGRPAVSWKARSFTDIRSACANAQPGRPSGNEEERDDEATRGD